MLSILCPQLLRVYSTLPQHVSQAVRIADARPGIKCLVQLRSHFRTACQNALFAGSSTLDSQVVIPAFRRDGRNATVPALRPTCRAQRRSENAYDSVKTLAWIIQDQHIRPMEADIFQKTVLGFCPRQLQKLFARSTPMTNPDGPITSAAGIVEAPEPQQTSKTRAPVCGDNL